MFDKFSRASSWRRMVWVTALMAAVGTTACGASAPKPLEQMRLMALVAGNVLPETVVQEIDANGLAFHPSDAYKALLRNAAATDAELAAVAGAKVTVRDPRSETANAEALKHLSDAAAATKKRSYDVAATELKAALLSSMLSPETGFVMGEVLRQQDRWGESELMYQAVLATSPDFRAAHTKRSFVFYKSGDEDNALIEAKAALESMPNDAEAHKNAGLALQQMRKFDAAAAEYSAALKLKPDYEAVHNDLGNLLNDQGQVDEAIVEYRKSISLDPTDEMAPYNLGIALAEKGELDAAVQQYRRAIQLKPSFYAARENMAGVLEKSNRWQEAVDAYREMVKMFPDNSICHSCLGHALFGIWDFDGAMKEFRTAIRLDPALPDPHTGIGDIYEEQKRYDDAMTEFRTAIQLDPTAIDAHRGAGRVLLKQNKFDAAITELKFAETAAPSDANLHDLYGRALEGAGKHGEAAKEFEEAALLDSKNLQVRLRMAKSLEGKGDWAAAMEAYRQAAQADASVDMRNKLTRSDEMDPAKEFAAAQERYQLHLAALKAAGKTAEAATVESGVKNSESATGLSDKINEAMQKGWSATQQKDFDNARADYQQAVTLEERMHPADDRLLTALDHVGMCSIVSEPKTAQAAFERELKEAGDLHGPNSLQVAQALQQLGTMWLYWKDYAAAEKSYFRAVDVESTLFGEGSDRVAEALRQASQVYLAQKDYPKAETYLLRAVHIDDSVYGKDSMGGMMPLASLCFVYEANHEYAKDEGCEKQLEGMVSKQYGASSPALVSVLQHESTALRANAKGGEADQIDQRIASIRAATMQ